ncbi:hypothetical protein DUNSADRAFT_4111 [Dunaliella salina]|uniref:Uncharacterized protein n=1 Tax=Dunaliella salina TaxID=3046 RepID=A0ABQ7GSN6_DUNSA|nr:hypothetical protein DUNSADRAFT_4111 [Dunaliella salina]|eukprot:KAF5837608.1 hypothetical protein DUNSADRAFT_4111 [Dunaliella salina]
MKNGPGKLYLSSNPKGHGESHKTRQKLAPLNAPHMSASPDAEGQASSSPSNGSPSHINTVRSLGLLHELQDYINSVESLTNEQKQELLRLREEKKAMERMTRHHGKASNGTVHLSGDFFRQSQLQELPPRLRAVLEDNKAMKEKLKNYKNRMLAAEHAANQKNSQIIIMENAISTLKQQLAACSRTPAQVESEENLKSMLYSSGRAVKNLEYEVNVLKQKVDTDSKLHRQAMAASRKEQAALERKIILLNATVAEKDIEIRKSHLEVKQLTRRLAPKRGQPSNMVSSSLDELEAQERMHMQMMMEGSHQQGSFYPASAHTEQQDQQQQEHEQQHQHEQAGHQPQQASPGAHEEERPLGSVLSLGMGMSPDEHQHADSQQPLEHQDQVEQQQDEPQGAGDSHGEDQGAISAANAGDSAALEAEAGAAEAEVPLSFGHQGEAAEQPPHVEREGVSEEHEAQGSRAEEAPQDAAEPSPSLAAVGAEPEEAAAAEPPAPAPSSLMQPEGDENQEHKEADVPARAEQEARPPEEMQLPAAFEGMQHSAAPKAVPFRQTAARAASRGPGQKKEPLPPASVPPKASLGAKAAKGSSSIRARESGLYQAQAEAAPAAPLAEPAGQSLEEMQRAPNNEPAAEEAKPTESETGGAAVGTAAEYTLPAANSSEAQSAGATQPAAESGEAAGVAPFTEGALLGGEGGDASTAAGVPAVEPEQVGEVHAEPAAAEPTTSAATEAPGTKAAEPTTSAATEQPGSAAGAPEQEAAGAQAELRGASATDAPPAGQTGALLAEPASESTAAAAAAEPEAEPAAAAAAAEPAAEPAAESTSVEPAAAAAEPAAESAAAEPAAESAAAEPAAESAAAEPAAESAAAEPAAESAAAEPAAESAAAESAAAKPAAESAAAELAAAEPAGSTAASPQVEPARATGAPAEQHDTEGTELAAPGAPGGPAAGENTAGAG